MATTTAGIVGFACGLVPLLALLVLQFYSQPDLEPELLWIPVIAVGPVRVHARVGDPRLGRERLLPRPRQRRRPPPAAVVVYLSPGLYSLSSLGRSRSKDHPIIALPGRPQPVRRPVRGLPRGHLRHRRTAACRTRRTSCRSAACWSAASCSSGSASSSSSGSSPTSRRSCEPQPIRDAAAISVEDLGVQYNLRFNRKTTLRAVVRRTSCLRRPAERSGPSATSTFSSATASRSRVIGPNGAGKSTLLQVLAGIMRPRRARSSCAARSRACSLGVGFDVELSGVENILLGGAFLGLDGPRIQELLPSIVEFADLGQFIEAPLKTYSSGMRARLGFAIATAVDPDILLLDEVLATGDANFRAKSKARVIELVRGGQGRRPRDPRHGLGSRVLQSGPAPREGPGDHRGPARTRSSRSTSSERRPKPSCAQRPPARPAWTRSCSGASGSPGAAAQP